MVDVHTRACGQEDQLWLGQVFATSDLLGLRLQGGASKPWRLTLHVLAAFGGGRWPLGEPNHRGAGAAPEPRTQRASLLSP